MLHTYITVYSLYIPVRLKNKKEAAMAFLVTVSPYSEGSQCNAGHFMEDLGHRLYKGCGCHKKRRGRGNKQQHKHQHVDSPHEGSYEPHKSSIESMEPQDHSAVHSYDLRSRNRQSGSLEDSAEETVVSEQVESAEDDSGSGEEDEDDADSQESVSVQYFV